MKLWLLRHKDQNVELEAAAGFVIRAVTADAARIFAARCSGTVGGDAYLDPDLTTVEHLLYRGLPGVILSDINTP
jgi:hypothetical protein